MAFGQFSRIASCLNSAAPTTWRRRTPHRTPFARYRQVRNGKTRSQWWRLAVTRKHERNRHFLKMVFRRVTKKKITSTIFPFKQLRFLEDCLGQINRLENNEIFVSPLLTYSPCCLLEQMYYYPPFPIYTA